MEAPIINKTTHEYRHTEKGNVKLTKLLNYKRMTQIKLNENTLVEDNVIMRGDLALIVIGRDSILCENVIIHPSLNNSVQPYEYKTLTIGSFCFIGKNSIISSLKVGNYVYIGENCILSDRTKVGDNVKILDNTYVPCDMQLIENGIYGGYPAQFLGTLNEQNSKYMQYLCNDYNDKFIISKSK